VGALTVVQTLRKELLGLAIAPGAPEEKQSIFQTLACLACTWQALGFIMLESAKILLNPVEDKGGHSSSSPRSPRAFWSKMMEKTKATRHKSERLLLYLDALMR
jgi:hypothetical protein